MSDMNVNHWILLGWYVGSFTCHQRCVAARLLPRATPTQGRVIGVAVFDIHEALTRQRMARSVTARTRPLYD